MGNFDWETFKDYAWNGGDVQSCYVEVHGGSDERELFCIDISHTGLSTMTEGEILLAVHVLGLFGFVIGYAIYIWRSSKDYKPPRL